MEYFTVQGRSQWEAMEKIRGQYGSTARILTRKNIRYGGWLGFFRKEGVEISGYLAKNPLPSAGKPSEAPASKPEVGDFDEEKRKILESVKKEQTLKLILQEIHGLKSKIAPALPNSEDSHPTLAKIKELMQLNEFTPAFFLKILERAKSEFSLEELEDVEAVQKSVVDWISGEIDIYTPNGKGREKPRIIIVIGPTGVGKTTTIAKLAAIYGLGNEPALQVRMVTIDNYRIAAKKQIETYADIMQIPISFAENRSDLAKIIDLYRDVDMILIDTIGKSPTDFTKLGEMKSILSACGSQSEIHLALSATTKTSDAYEILRHFEPFRYDSIILTKLDETTHLGNIISVLAENKKSISYLTDGQQVPQDIEIATTARLLAGLEGFRMDREELESKFDRPNVDKLNGWSMS
jgi:flagellar biosynthesis protein FlhF